MLDCKLVSTLSYLLINVLLINGDCISNRQCSPHEPCCTNDCKIVEESADKYCDFCYTSFCDGSSSQCTGLDKRLNTFEYCSTEDKTKGDCSKNSCDGQCLKNECQDKDRVQDGITRAAKVVIFVLFILPVMIIGCCCLIPVLCSNGKPKYKAQTYATQGYPGQPYPSQPYLRQPYPGQTYPGQAYGAQTTPAQAYPGPGYSARGYPSQTFQPNPIQPNHFHHNPIQHNPIELNLIQRILHNQLLHKHILDEHILHTPFLHKLFLHKLFLHKQVFDNLILHNLILYNLILYNRFLHNLIPRKLTVHNPVLCNICNNKSQSEVRTGIRILLSSSL
ncbi:hypothetical protein HDE_12855 [Halotydeus destructor]|nr:hypothetical protein HDE_12855 [Halotydeus destructor]